MWPRSVVVRDPGADELAGLIEIHEQALIEQLVAHPAVAEAAVVGKPDEIKGTGIAAFVTLEASHPPSDSLKDELQRHVVKQIGALARPDEIRFTDSLPKTRSGKIMRRLLRDIASGSHKIGDTTTLEDYSVLTKLMSEEE